MDYIDKILVIFDEYEKQHRSKLALREDLKRVIRAIEAASYSRGYDKGYDDGGERDWQW